MIKEKSGRFSKFAQIAYYYIFLLNTIPFVLGLVALVSCETKNNKQAEGTEYLEKNLRVSLTENIKTLNPLKFSNKSEIFLGKQLYEGLYTRNTAGNVIPELLQGAELDTISKKYTFTLKKGQKFSNGDVVTSKDIYQCFGTIFGEANVNPAVERFRNNVVGFAKWWTNRNEATSSQLPSGFQLVDDYSVSLSVLKIDETLVETLAATTFLIYKELEGNKFIGSGPFEIEYANDDISYNLKRNPFYAVETNDALIDGINIRFIKNPNAALDEFINGSLDVLSYKASDPTNVQIEKAVANNYDYKDYVQQYSGSMRYMLFHNFSNRNDIMKTVFNLNQKNTDHRFVGFLEKTKWKYDTINFEFFDKLSQIEPDTTKIGPIPVINKSQYDNNELLNWLTPQGGYELFQMASMSNIDPNAEYIVIDETRMERLQTSSYGEVLKYLAKTLPNQKPNLGLTVIGYEHDLIIFDERFSGFTKFGDWSLDIKNLTYTKPRLIE
ncbi:MAG: ABC transporter substrate-binding protein [Cyclobacteriaceae bacterium]